MTKKKAKAKTVKQVKPANEGMKHNINVLQIEKEVIEKEVLQKLDRAKINSITTEADHMLMRTHQLMNIDRAIDFLTEKYL